jgi:transposase
MIKSYFHHLSIRHMCKMLGISKSCYYGWLNRQLSKGELDDAKLAVRIKAIFDAEKSRAGAQRITKRLKGETWRVSKRGARAVTSATKNSSKRNCLFLLNLQRLMLIVPV